MNLLITGGASGLGLAITERLARNPAHAIWISYFSSADSAQALEHTHPNVRAIRADFKDLSQVEDLIGRLDEINPDALINNAVSMPISKTHFHRTQLEAFRDGFNFNILPTIMITQKVIELFRKKRAGRIVTVLTATLVGRPPAGYAEYTAGKAYLHSLAKSWAAENAAFGITSNCVSPSYMATRLTSDTDERIVEGLVSRHPLKRLLTTAEVAEAVEFFLSAPAHINGTNLVINAASELS